MDKGRELKSFERKLIVLKSNIRFVSQDVESFLLELKKVNGRHRIIQQENVGLSGPKYDQWLRNHFKKLANKLILSLKKLMESCQSLDHNKKRREIIRTCGNIAVRVQNLRSYVLEDKNFEFTLALKEAKKVKRLFNDFYKSDILKTKHTNELDRFVLDSPKVFYMPKETEAFLDADKRGLLRLRLLLSHFYDLFSDNSPVKSEKNKFLIYSQAIQRIKYVLKREEDILISGKNSVKNDQLNSYNKIFAYVQKQKENINVVERLFKKIQKMVKSRDYSQTKPMLKSIGHILDAEYSGSREISIDVGEKKVSF